MKPQVPLVSEPFLMRMARHMARALPKGRSALVRRVARWTGAPGSFVATIDGVRWPIQLDERVSRTLYVYGSFEPGVVGLFTRLLAPGQTVVDVGANFGYFTVLAAQRVGASGRVLAFEPDPRNIARLRTTLALNELHQAEVVPAAVCDYPGTVRLHMASENEDNLGSSSIVQDGAGRTTIEVPAVTLDAFLDERKLQKVDLLKMDIEGAELAALTGGLLALRTGRIRRVMLELHRLMLTAEEAERIHQMMRAAGFEAWYMAENGLEKLDDVTGLTEPNPHLLYSLDGVPGAE